MDKNLLKDGVLKFVIGLIVVGLLIFVPAGTIFYYRGWLFMGLLFIPMLIMGLLMYVYEPNLLRSRLNAKESVNEQKIVVLLSGFIFLCGFIVAGLNYRYKWLILPNFITFMASFIFLLAYLLYAEVLRENAYLSRTIEVQKNQTVIDTGLYGIVRHPMYLVTILMFLAIPLILGSLLSFLIFLIYPLLIMVRINNEERLLEEQLNGYKLYKNKVKYKLIPFIW